jgi:hypothetical protein
VRRAIREEQPARVRRVQEPNLAFPGPVNMPAKWTRNHILEIGSIVLIVGLILTVISFTYKFVSPTPGSLSWYSDLVKRPEGDYNLFVFIVGPILLIMGIFYVGEQIVLRRRFEKMIDTPKKSEFASRRKDLEDLAKRLPSHFEDKIDAKEAEFKSKRAA